MPSESEVLSNLANAFGLKEPERNQDKLDVCVAFHSADKGSEVFHTGSTSAAIEPNKDPKKVSGHNLMDWNPTAETHVVI